MEAGGSGVALWKAQHKSGDGVVELSGGNEDLFVARGGSGPLAFLSLGFLTSEVS